MKPDVQKVCDRCITCRKSKSKVLLYGLNTSLPLPKKPMVDISMDFVLGLPRSKKERDFIFVVVDGFSKMSGFIACHKIYDVNNIIDFFLIEIVGLHRVLKSIISDRDVNFFSYF